MAKLCAFVSLNRENVISICHYQVYTLQNQINFEDLKLPAQYNDGIKRSQKCNVPSRLIKLWPSSELNNNHTLYARYHYYLCTIY